jgi:hypothetical protein
VPTGDEDSRGGAVDVPEPLLGNEPVPEISPHGGGAQEVEDEEQEALE